ncbi:MAG TPA: DNA ligase D [Solirubrobacteraceae bacterium]|jgi:bifunctional non-homologous end joining protein LigD|nr:DNA ligase D [Solirubrobacteraceae bacterium]
MDAKRSKSSQKLTEYRQKRSFEATPEPQEQATPDARDQAAGAGLAAPRFVVHEHHATRLHWDLRLEHDGTLASWAIPNGIPDDPKHNRKAIHVEDHPLSYLEFQGTIPAGNYGAGEVKVWDRGTYTCEKWQDGEVVAVFHGERLRGRYALFRAGRSEKDWMVHRMDPPLDPTAQEMPEFVQPMLARPSTLPAAQSEWAFEVKWDGVRAIAHSQPGRIKLLSRNGNEVTTAYPELRALNRALGTHSAILDGEIVAFDESGRPSFEQLQPRMHLRGEAALHRLSQSAPVTYVLFDLLWLDGHSLMGLPYRERRSRLAALGLEQERWRTPAFHAGEGSELLAATRELGVEGIVAKRLDSHYAPGARNGSWLKIKHTLRQEAVIGGWTDGKGSRSARIGALHLGIHDEQGLLRYAGRVGSGFDANELKCLAEIFQPLAQQDSPFAGPQPPRGAHFLEPSLVCEVEFTAWTREGLLRHPVYKGLRDDKAAIEVVREQVQAPQEVPVSADSETNDFQRLLEQGRQVRGGTEIEVEGRTLKLTNLDKELYPGTGFSKADLIGYYAAVAPALLPHLLDRPLTLKRYPNGVEEEHFYEKQCPKHRPEWVQTTTVWSEHNKREIHYCLCQDLPTLLWLANLACIELHPSLARAQAIERPRSLTFDLDPGEPAGVLECCEIALELRDMFAELGMRTLVKTSGSKGLQVYVPLNDDKGSYEQTKPFAHAVADLLEHRSPQLVVSSMVKAQRPGKVLIDWSQNDEHKTTVSVYSLRAMASPTVSTPVSWEEIQTCRDAGDPRLLEFEAAQALQRVAEQGDLFAEMISLSQQLPALGE